MTPPWKVPAVERGWKAYTDSYVTAMFAAALYLSVFRPILVLV